MDNAYGKTLRKLYQIKDEKYAEFSSKIANSNYPLIGIRIPILRKIANELLKGKYFEYLKNCQFTCFEDTLLFGLIVAKLENKDFLEFLPIYLKNADSWSHIDSFVASINFVNKNKEQFLTFIKNNIEGAEGFELRFYLVALMTFYLDEENLSYIFSTCERFDEKGYYNDMAIAWLISVAFVKFKEKTFEFIKNCKLSNFTLNKSISKINDSFRVTKESKTLLKNYYRKK